MLLFSLKVFLRQETEPTHELKSRKFSFQIGLWLILLSMGGERRVGRSTWILCCSPDQVWGAFCTALCCAKPFTQGLSCVMFCITSESSPFCAPALHLLVFGSWDPLPSSGQLMVTSHSGSSPCCRSGAGADCYLTLGFVGEGAINMRKKWERIFPLIHSVTAALHLLQCGSCHQNSSPDPNLHFPQISECFKLESITFFFPPVKPNKCAL